ncbi:uncharacterized protein LOC127264819 [Andrographis paniculata]|uniref:uncharacterized protein LOC127264819 n=1 Tax=Andrographis paniculata TaxID=175694 RepID=UPI0021E95C49|nr:uncharacterized protein LOC127264819 [Andrographis paniculata]
MTIIVKLVESTSYSSTDIHVRKFLGVLPYTYSATAAQFYSYRPAVHLLRVSFSSSPCSFSFQVVPPLLLLPPPPPSIKLRGRPSLLFPAAVSAFSVCPLVSAFLQPQYVALRKTNKKNCPIHRFEQAVRKNVKPTQYRSRRLRRRHVVYIGPACSEFPKRMAKGLIWATAEDMARNRARLAKKAEARAIFLVGSEERSLHNIQDLIDTGEYALSCLRKGEIPKLKE